jgi:hypothetical protein
MNIIRDIMRIVRDIRDIMRNNEKYNDGDQGDALDSRSDGIIGTGKLEDGPLADHEDSPGSKRGHDRWSREFNGRWWGLKDGSLADHEDSARYRGPKGVMTGDQESSSTDHKSDHIGIVGND